MYSWSVIPANVIEIHTPKKYVLNGLWFGPQNPRRVVIWVHGLSSSAFSKLSIVRQLVDDDTAVLTFNNRGHDTITRISRINSRKKEGYDRVLAGGAHEIFIDCVDDIQGAVDVVRLQGARDIFLAGHSTGCQKSVYYATRKGNEGKVRGLILLAPISDYASALHFDTQERRLRKAEREARALIRKKKANTIVPGWWLDAQRFLSLYTKDSTEEIFTYVDPMRTPKIYRALTTPALVILAEKDEYSDRPAEQLAEWFATHSRAPRFESVIIPKADHSFHGFETSVVNRIREWISA